MSQLLSSATSVSSAPPDAAAFIGTLAQLIELAGSLLIAGYVVVALWALLRRRAAGIPRARRLVASGAIAGLDFKLAAALLKTLQLHTWSQLGMFAAILALRILLKRVFSAEARGPRAANDHRAG